MGFFVKKKLGWVGTKEVILFCFIRMPLARASAKRGKKRELGVAMHRAPKTIHGVCYFLLKNPRMMPRTTLQRAASPIWKLVGKLKVMV